MFCLSCGHELPDDAKFCSSCGSKIDPAPSPDMPAEEEPVKPSPELLMEFQEALTKGDWMSATEVAESYVLPIEDNLELRRLLAAAYIKRARTQVAYLSHEEYYRLVDNATDLDPDNIEALWINSERPYRGTFLEHNSLQTVALDHIIQACTRQIRESGAVTSTLLERSTALYEKALRLRRATSTFEVLNPPEFNMALADANAAISAEPTNLDAYMTSAKIRQAMGDLASAVEAYTDALRNTKDSPATLAHARGLARLRVIDAAHRHNADDGENSHPELEPALNDAIADFDNAIAEGLWSALAGRAKAFLRKHDYDFALRDMLDLQRHSNHAGEYFSWSHFDSEISQIISEYLIAENRDSAIALATSHYGRLTYHDLSSDDSYFGNRGFILALRLLMHDAIYHFVDSAEHFPYAAVPSLLQRIVEASPDPFRNNLIAAVFDYLGSHERRPMSLRDDDAWPRVFCEWLETIDEERAKLYASKIYGTSVANEPAGNIDEPEIEGSEANVKETGHE